MTPVVLSWGNYPNGYCFPNDLNQFKDDTYNLLAGTVDVNGVVVSQTTPAVGDRDKAWFKLDSSGRPAGVFIFLGSWLWPHPTPASGPERRMYAGADGAGDLWAYDGGDGTDPAGATPTTGSFWAIDHDFDFRIPIGPGTNSVTYDGNPATVIAQGANTGVERVTLAQGELPAVQLGLNDGASASGYFGSADSTGAPAGPQRMALGQAGLSAAINKTLTDFLNTGTSSAAPAQTSQQNMPPVRGIYIIKRSARIFTVGA